MTRNEIALKSDVIALPLVPRFVRSEIPPDEISLKSDAIARDEISLKSDAIALPLVPLGYGGDVTLPDAVAHGVGGRDR